MLDRNILKSGPNRPEVIAQARHRLTNVYFLLRQGLPSSTAHSDVVELLDELLQGACKSAARDFELMEAAWEGERRSGTHEH